MNMVCKCTFRMLESDILFIIWSFYAGRALVTTGYPYGNGIQTEVIDFKNENISCETLPDFPIKLEAATGGLLFNSVPMVCGGLSFDPKLIIHSNCYIVGQEEPITSLNTARYFSASVVLNNRLGI